MLLNCGAREDSWESLAARRSNQSILKEINLEYSLEGLMLKLKLQSFGHLMQRANSLERPWLRAGENFFLRERLRAGGERGNRGWNGWMTSSTQWTWVRANSERQWRTQKPGVLQSLGSQRAGHNLATEQQQYVESKICYKWIYLQNRFTDTENEVMVTRGESGWGRDELGVRD